MMHGEVLKVRINGIMPVHFICATSVANGSYRCSHGAELIE